MACYPDYGKTPPEYFVVMTNLLASYPQSIVQRIADPRSGIPSKTKFLPTVADVTELADEIIDRQRIMSKPTPILTKGIPALKPFRPFPRLWEAFAGDQAALDALDPHKNLSLNFETMDRAAYLLATEGKQAARDYLTAA